MKNLFNVIIGCIFLFSNHLIAQNNIPVTVAAEEGATSLQWKTSTETNSSYFIVETSVDNQSYVIIGRIKAAGYSQTKREYELLCSNPDALKTYIRVSLVSMDGTYNSSVVLNMNANTTNTSMANK